MCDIYKNNDCASVHSHDFKEHIRKIFKNHYFSNHWEFAISLESELNAITGKKHNITYMNSSVALISMLYILDLRKGDSVALARGVSLFPWVQNCLDYMGVNSCPVDASVKYSCDDVLISLDIEQVGDINLISCFSDRNIIIPTRLTNQALVYNECVSIYDMGVETCFGMSTGAFVSVTNDDHADKLRWMRSSYARTGNVSVFINGNGRFSEIQAAEALVNIKNNKLKENIFCDINAEVSKAIEGSATQIQYISSEYTSGIIKIINPNHKILNEINSLSIENGILFDAPQNKSRDNSILVRLPMNARVRKSLLNVLVS